MKGGAGELGVQLAELRIERGGRRVQEDVDVLVVEGKAPSQLLQADADAGGLARVHARGDLASQLVGARPQLPSSLLPAATASARSTIRRSRSSCASR